MKKDDGGRAYPAGASFYSGMTVRDVFAGRALAGLLSRDAGFVTVAEDNATAAARITYEYAQAMINEKRRLEEEK